MRRFDPVRTEPQWYSARGLGMTEIVVPPMWFATVRGDGPLRGRHYRRAQRLVKRVARAICAAAGSRSRPRLVLERLVWRGTDGTPLAGRPWLLLVRVPDQRTPGTIGQPKAEDQRVRVTRVEEGRVLQAAVTGDDGDTSGAVRSMQERFLCERRLWPHGPVHEVFRSRGIPLLWPAFVLIRQPVRSDGEFEALVLGPVGSEAAHS